MLLLDYSAVNESLPTNTLENKWKSNEPIECLSDMLHNKYIKEEGGLIYEQTKIHTKGT